MANTGMRAAMTALIGEPARRPPTYPAIMGPAGWIHQSRKERIKMTREDDQKENGVPSPWNRPTSLSTSIRYTPGWCALGRGLPRDRLDGRSSSSSLGRRGHSSHRSNPMPIPARSGRTLLGWAWDYFDGYYG